jgi:hypothetical protein
MIPETIHYCWFGDNSKPELAQKCILSWKKYFPAYEIKEWNESNYDVHKIPYVDEAYNKKKFAFVSDYARFDVLYQYGGIYFDTDVEVIKPFDDILEKGGFLGLQTKGLVAAGLGIGCNAGLEMVYQILNFYSTLHFINPDGSYNTRTVVEYVTAILRKHGLKRKNTIQKIDEFVVYPTEYFCPMSHETGKLKITDNTYSIHHFDGSWLSNAGVKTLGRRRKIYSLLGYNYVSKLLVFSEELFVIVINFFYRFFVKLGPINTIKYYWHKLISRV